MEENQQITPRTPILEGKPMFVKLMFWGVVGVMVYAGYKIVTKKHGHSF